MATKGIVTFLPSASRISSGSSVNSIYSGENSEAIVYLDITDVSGTTPTLDVVIEDSIDGTNWDNIETFTQASTTGRQIKRIGNFSRYMRINFTIGGESPDFTFSVKAYFK